MGYNPQELQAKESSALRGLIRKTLHLLSSQAPSAKPWYHCVRQTGGVYHGFEFGSTWNNCQKSIIPVEAEFSFQSVYIDVRVTTM